MKKSWRRSFAWLSVLGLLFMCISNGTYTVSGFYSPSRKFSTYSQDIDGLKAKQAKLQRKLLDDMLAQGFSDHYATRILNAAKLWTYDIFVRSLEGYVQRKGLRARVKPKFLEKAREYIEVSQTLLTLDPPAQPARPPDKITVPFSNGIAIGPDPRQNATGQQVLDALITDPVCRALVSGVTVSATDSNIQVQVAPAYGQTALGSDGSLLLMSSGDPFAPREGADIDFQPGGCGGDTARIDISFNITDPLIRSMSFNFDFYSYEFDEFVGAGVNDFVYAFWDQQVAFDAECNPSPVTQFCPSGQGCSQATSTDGGLLTFDSQSPCRPTNVDNAFFSLCSDIGCDNPSGTPGWDTINDGTPGNDAGRTGVLNTSWPVTTGPHTLTLLVGDAGDGIFTTVGVFDQLTCSTAQIGCAVTTGGCSIECPADIDQSNDPGQCGAVVNYPAPTASEGCGQVTCNPPSGSFFPVGTTTVNCSAQDDDDDGESASSCSFTVTIRDTELPRITCPDNLTVSTTGQNCTAEANYVLAAATDNCPGVTVICLPPSGLTLPVGTSSVDCTATDAAGNTSNCSFTITVRDGVAPSVTCPTAPIAVNAGNNCAAAMPDVRSSVTATDSCTPAANLTVTQSIPVGSPLPPGQTIVTVSVADSGGNISTCQVVVNVTGGTPPTAVIAPATVNLDTVSVTSTVKKKKKKVKPAQSTGTFTIQNTGCSPLNLTFRALERVTDRARFRNPDDRAFFSVFLRNPDGSAGEELIGRNVPAGRQLSIAPNDTVGFVVRFEPTIPQVAGCTDSTCLRAEDVLPNSFVSELLFDGTTSAVRFNASVARGVKLIDPQNPNSNTPVVTLCRGGDEFIIRYHVFSTDKSDVRTARYEFLDSSNNVVTTIDNVDLAGPLSQSNVVNGQPFNVEHAFAGANSNEQVNSVRVTVSGSNSSSTATSSAISTNCAASLQLFGRGQRVTLSLPVARIGSSKP